MRIFNIINVLFLLWLAVSCKKSNSNPGSGSGFKVFATHHSIIGVRTIRLANGNFVAAMQETDNLNYCLLIDIDSTGREIWRREFANDLKIVTDLQPTQDTGIIIASIDDSSQLNCYLTALSSNGAMRWNTTYTPNIDSFLVQSVVLGVSPDNSVSLLVGMSNPVDSGYNKLSCLKYSSQGQKLSENVINTGTDLIFSCLQMTNNNNGFLISGFYRNRLAWRNKLFSDGSFLLNTDNIGNVNWLKLQPLDSIYGGSLTKYATFTGTGICCAGSESCFQSGIITQLSAGTQFMRSFPMTDLGNLMPLNTGNLLVLKANPLTGDTISVNTYQLQNVSKRAVICCTADGGCIVAATDNIYTYDSYYPIHTTLLKLDQNLAVQWQQGYNFPYTTSPFGIFQTAGGKFLMFAVITSMNSYTDLALIKTDSKGNIK